jgi:hypothetical protein
MSELKNTSYRIINWLDLVKDMWGPEFYEPDVAYKWSNDREFKDTQEAPGPE